MSSFKIFDIAGSGLSAESVRLNTVASNLANADSVSGDPSTVYKARHPVFQAEIRVEIESHGQLAVNKMSRREQSNTHANGPRSRAGRRCGASGVTRRAQGGKDLPHPGERSSGLRSRRAPRAGARLAMPHA